MVTQPAPVSLVRAIGRWSLTALVVNSIIGSGIFALPDDIKRWNAGPTVSSSTYLVQPRSVVLLALSLGDSVG